MGGYVAGPLRLKYWPFDLVPRPGGEIRWADRKELKQRIEVLARRIGRHDAVSLHLLWADFGAGKTHALLYLKQEIERHRFGAMLPFYCALPKGCRAFLDIYRAIVRGIPAQALKDAHDAAQRAVGREAVVAHLSSIWANLLPCFRAIAIGSDAQQQVALGWLHAEPGLVARELQGLSLRGRIRSTDEAVLALTGIVRLCELAGYKRTLLMIDEFQRVEALRRQQQDDINAGLHGFFNACGHGMSLLLSFSFGVEENIRHFLNAELLSRVDPLRISIPVLTRDEGLVFLNDVVTDARETADKWPIAEDVIPTIIDGVATRLDLTPRRLIKAAGLVFDLAAMEFEDGNITQLDGAFVTSMIARGDFKRVDEGEGED